MSSLANINTVDPIALRSLMTETIFSVEGGAISVDVETLPESEPVRKPEQTTLQFSFYGKNQRNYLFVTDDKQHEWMSETALDAFTKTLVALKLTADDVAVLNVGKLSEMPPVESISTFFKPNVVVCLGAPLTWPKQGGIKIFQTHSFDEMLADAEKKRIFWTTIKNLLV